jgi:LuxR family maltose regulon positive regulatory protein
VTALDVGRSWFRYHRLFADLLSLELRRVSPRLIPMLHRAAAEWLEQHGYVVDAIRHAQAACDWPLAALLLADNYVGLVLDGRKDTLRGLLAAFPADAAEADAELALSFATGRLYDGLLAESSAYIAAAEERVAAVPAERRRLFDRRLTSARLWLACQRGDLEAARQAMRSLEGQSADTSTRGSDHRASGLMSLGTAELWSLHVDDARRHLEEALALARRIGRPYLEVGCLGHLALAAVLEGAIPAGLRLSEEAVEIAEPRGWRTQRIVAPAVAAGAAALAWRGRVDEAEQWLERVEPAGAREEELDAEPVLHHAHGFVRLGKGRYRQALADFRAAERAQPRLVREHVLAADVRGWTVHAQVLVGDAAGARAALAALDARERGGTGMRLAEAALELADGSPERAIALLAPVIASAPAAGGSPQVLQPRWATIHALLLDAVARDHLGDPGAAEASLERALGLAEPEGVILPFLVVEIGDLLERHRGHRTAHAALLAEILDVRAGSSSVADARALLEPLSDAELRVLRYLPSNLRAPEIAAELLISCNTVRTHLRHIYAKLDAHSRNEAVTRARRLGLLAPTSRLR